MDVFTRIDTSKVNSRVLEALVKSGAFDSLEPNRKRILEGIDKILSLAHAEKSLNLENQVSFFDLLPEQETEKSRTKIELPDVPDWKMKNRLKFEKEALGFYISGHPLNPFNDEISRFTKISKSIDLKNPDHKINFKETISIAGVITAKTVRLSRKNNDRWAMLTVEDLWGTIEVLAFAKIFKEASEILNAETFDDPVLITGYIKFDDESRRLVAQSIKSVPKIRAERSALVEIKLPRGIVDDALESIRQMIQKHPGNCPVMLSLKSENNCLVDINLQEKVQADEAFVDDLEELLPLENLVFHYSSDMLA